MKTVLVFGAFDGLHPGHRWFLRRAGTMGNRLVAVVARDIFISQWKGKAPGLNETTRLEILKASGLVDLAIMADEEIHTYGVLRVVKPDIICLGHDQNALRMDIVEHIRENFPDEPVPRIHIVPPWKRRLYNSTRMNRTSRQGT